MADGTVYPYIPNSVPEVKEEMLKTVGISSTEDIYAEIPAHLRFKRKLETPGPIPSEYALRRHVEEILDKNKDCKQYIGFLGGGVWNHHVPSVVTTIMERDEFLTSYVGEAYADHGKWQAQFEFASCIAELVEMDMVNTPTYDWGMAAATSIRMASRITGRGEALYAANIGPERLSCMKNYAWSAVPTFTEVAIDPTTGLTRSGRPEGETHRQGGRLLLREPRLPGHGRDAGGRDRRARARRRRPRSCGRRPDLARRPRGPRRLRRRHRLRRRAAAGHPHAGRWRPGRLRRHPGRAAVHRRVPLAALRRHADGRRRRVRLRRGLLRAHLLRLAREGQGLPRHDGPAARHRRRRVPVADGSARACRSSARASCSARRTARPGLPRCPASRRPRSRRPSSRSSWSTSTVPARRVAEINKALLAHKIHGGKDLSSMFPSLGQSALYCVTEVHTKGDLDALVGALKEIL